MVRSVVVGSGDGDGDGVACAAASGGDCGGAAALSK